LASAVAGALTLFSGVAGAQETQAGAGIKPLPMPARLGTVNQQMLDGAGQDARNWLISNGRRKNPVMSPMAANLSKEDMQDLAKYFSSKKPAGNNFKPDPARVSAGAKKSNETLCSMCHLDRLKGQNEIPRLAGQQPDYVIKQLKDFRSRTRTNDGGNMTSVSQSLSDDDITNLAHYIGGLY
jgi:cytochrome c553